MLTGPVSAPDRWPELEPGLLFRFDDVFLCLMERIRRCIAIMSKAGRSSEGEVSGPETAGDVTKSSLAKVRHEILPFVIGGASGIAATTCLQPVDMIKVRLQLLGQGCSGAKTVTPLRAARMIIAEGGVLGLYSGISAAWLRQACYATLRLGFFDRFLDFFQSRARSQGRELRFSERAAASLSAGGLAAALANPAEVGLIRMQSDGMKSPRERANYRSVVDALTRVAKSEGVLTLWHGFYPTIIRAMATNFGSLTFFSESKAQLKRHTSLSDRNRTFTASAVAGFFASFFSLPFDFLKTRLQRGGGAYTGVFDCAVRVAREEGLLRFYRGFGTYFVRIAPHSIITLIVADNLKAVLMPSSEL